MAFLSLVGFANFGLLLTPGPQSDGVPLNYGLWTFSGKRRGYFQWIFSMAMTQLFSPITYLFHFEALLFALAAARWHLELFLVHFHCRY